MARTAALRATPWNAKLKQNEHEALFLALKLSGQQVAECPGVHILHDHLGKKRKDYVKHSHRHDGERFTVPACEMFPGMECATLSLVVDGLRSRWCDQQ